MTSFMTALNEERDRLAHATKRGIGMPVAGLLYWLAMAWITRHYPTSTAAVLGFFLTGAVFPIGVVFTKLAGGNLFAKSEGLTSLGMILNLVQLLYWPVLILVWSRSPEWTVWVMAVLFGSHFLPYSWLYRTRAYGFLTLSIAISLTGLALITRDPLTTTVPLITAGCYAITVLWLWRDNAATVAIPSWRSRHQ